MIIEHDHYEIAGQKDYDVWMLSGGPKIDNYVLVMRYGKVGTTGQLRVKTFDNLEQAAKYRNKVRYSRVPHGYSEDLSNKYIKEPTVASIESIMGEHAHRLKKEHLDHLGIGDATIAFEEEPKTPREPVDRVKQGVERYGENSNWGTW